MPKLNLRDDEMGEEPNPMEGGESSDHMPPSLRDIGDEGEGRRGRSILLQVVLALVALAAIVYALNHFGVIHLWGKKAPAVTEAFPEAEMTPPADQPVAEPSQPALTEAETPAVTTPEPAKPATKARIALPPPPSGTGTFTVQVSSWESRATADAQAAALVAKGLPAFVEEGVVEGETWHRVRVGRFATEADAEKEAARLADILGGEPFAAQTRLR